MKRRESLFVDPNQLKMQMKIFAFFKKTRRPHKSLFSF